VRDAFGRRGIQRAVHRDDAAEGRYGIAPQCQIPGLRQIRTLRHAAWIGVFDDHHGGLIELGDALECRVGIVQVIVRKLLALRLPRGGHARARAADVERRVLMRVFAVA